MMRTSLATRMAALAAGRLRRTLAGTALLLLAAGTADADLLPLWEIAGASNRMSILGSIHYLRPGSTLPPAILAAYEDADVIFMEIDLDDLDPLAAQAAMQRLGIDPQGRTLDVLLGEAGFREATEKARALGFDLALMRGLEPWLAALTITQLQLVQLGFDSQAGVEQQLLRRASRDGKPVEGLETLDDQLAALDALPPQVQRAFLLQTLDEATDIAGRIDEIVGAWETGDTDAMETELLDSLRDQPEIYRRVVVDRNRRWAASLAPLLRQRKDYLVVVGTLHLVGPDSLIQHLTAAGYRPQQVGTQRDVAVE
jgi:uncharacterized protein YbaP (TraB family)